MKQFVALEPFSRVAHNPLSHEETVASQHYGQLLGFIPICDMTGNELPILAVYHSSNLISFRRCKWPLRAICSPSGQYYLNVC
jgi:hypothetical protein